MFHKAYKLEFMAGTSLRITFQNGEIKDFDVSILFEKYPQLKLLKNRKLFTSGRLISPYGIMWNDDLDLEVETVYEEGTLSFQVNPINMIAANAVRHARALSEMTQKDLADKSGIDQSDISKIERGVANPSVATLERIATALNLTLNISIE